MLDQSNTTETVAKMLCVCHIETRQILLTSSTKRVVFKLLQINVKVIKQEFIAITVVGYMIRTPHIWITRFLFMGATFKGKMNQSSQKRVSQMGFLSYMCDQKFVPVDLRQNFRLME